MTNETPPSLNNELKTSLNKLKEKCTTLKTTSHEMITEHGKK
jgi:hypothetical protein